MMSDARALEILDTALDLEPSRRQAYLAQACGDDEDLRERVTNLIRASDQSESFLRVVREPTQPRSIGPYRVIREIGRGSAGVVYLVEDSRLRRQIALKTFPPDWSASGHRREMLREEALALASLTQPNVAHVYTFEEAEAEFQDGTLPNPHVFITMEFVDGVTLGEHLREGRLALEEAIEIGRQIAAAMEAAHRAGIVHRDLKPQNVRITPEGWVKVLDFGLAMMMPDEVVSDPDQRETSSGESEDYLTASRSPLSLQRSAGPVDVAFVFQGTPGYMSPEQIDGAAVDPRTDIWALGCILFECVTGFPAIEGHGVSELIDRTKAGTVAWHRLDGADALSGTDERSMTLSRVKTLLRRCLDPAMETRLTSAAEARRLMDEELLRLRAAPFMQPQASAPGPSQVGRLPQARSEFIGRDDVLRNLESASAQHRLVTVTGAGGAGKTRIALELGTRVRAEYEDGVWFIDLVELTDGRRIAESFAFALDLRNTLESDLELAVHQRLRDHSALLLVDNCEHLVDDVAGFLGRLLDDCPRVRVVATSREALHLPGEQVHALEPLQLPSEAAPGSEVMASEAVRLFLTRAASRHSSFALDATRAALIARICRRLDGLPLAIELAAGQTRALSLEELAERIEADSRFLTSSSRQGTTRHQSLDQLIEWSFRLLDVAERRVFTRLCLFRGGWSLDAAEAVCVDVDVDVATWDVCPILTRLVEKSLVQADTAGKRVRYRLLETVREFAARHLLGEHDAPAVAQLEERFVRFVTSDAEPLANESGWTDADWLSRIDLDRGNLTRALEISLERGRADWALRLAVFLGRRAAQIGYWKQGLDLANDVLSMGRSPGHLADAARTDSADRVLVLAFSAESAAVLDDFSAAEAFLTEATALANGRPDPGPLARTYTAAGVVEYYRARFEDAEVWQAKAERIHRDLDEKAGLAVNLAYRGRIRSVAGRHDEAEGYYQESLLLHRELGDQPGAARVLVNLGRTAHLLGENQKGRVLLEEALAAYRKANDAHGIALCLANLGDIAHSADHDPERAWTCYHEAMQIRSRAGQSGALCSVLISIAMIAADTGQTSEAAQIIAAVMKAYQAHGLVLYEAADTLITHLQERLESELQPTDLQKAREHGRQMSLKQLVAFIECKLGPLR